MEVQNYHVRRFFGTVLSFGTIGHVLELYDLLSRRATFNKLRVRLLPGIAFRCVTVEHQRMGLNLIKCHPPCASLQPTIIFYKKILQSFQWV